MTTYPSVQTTPEIRNLLKAHAPIAFGVSGGKDGAAATLAANTYLNRIGHAGPRILIHSDLGRVEWKASLPQCELLAKKLGLELVVVRRVAGDMLDRWLSRWAANCERYANLECVKLILPWSTPGMRFCTSELKTAIICRELIRRFPGQRIINVTGIRAEESASRASKPTCKEQNGLTSKTHDTTGVDWLPIHHWTLEHVIAIHTARRFPMHEGYTTNGRISCAYCIMSSQDDLSASTTWPEHHESYRIMVNLECDSTFAFQGAHWLGDVAPHLLSAAERAALVDAKQRAAERVALEATIPAHLLYTKGWPTVMPTRAEARLLADVRTKVAALLGLAAFYLDADLVIGRYAELMRLAQQRREA